MGWGAGWGPPMGGGGRPGAPIGSLPFAGIPSELQAGVDGLLAEEPDHGPADVHFDHRMADADREPLTLRRLLLAYPRLLWASAGLIAVTVVASQAGPELTKYAINDGMIQTLGRHIHFDFTFVVAMACAYILSVAIAGVTQRWLVQVTGRLAAHVMNDLRIRVFTHIQRLSLDYFTSEKAGVIMTRMTSDIENLQQLLQDGLAQFAIQGLTMLVIGVLLFETNWLLALIVLALVVPALVVLSSWFRIASERGYERVRDGIADVMADLSESVHGVRIVTAHNRQAHNVVRHRNVVGEYRDANIYTAHINAVYGPGSQFVGVLGQGALLGIGGYMVLHGSLSIGALVAFFLYVNRFFQPIQLLVQQYNSFQQGQSSVLKLRTLFGTEPSVLEDPDAVDLPPIEGEIVFDDVTFGYDPAFPVIEGIDLRIAPGETVAFVGPTGAGKSTLAKLITRFYDPTRGRVLIDGHDLHHVTLSSLRQQLGVVPQEPFLFAGTIRDNITFARPDAPDAEVAEAVAKVGLGELVDRLPDGVDTLVHERGQSLSSGERQLIALARAFLAHPRVLVLDEATSNLDLQSETRIEAALDVLLEDRTAVLIAHRLSTAMRADRIVVVDNGTIAESGTHDELVASGGLYASMYATWVSHAQGSVVA